MKQLDDKHIETIAVMTIDSRRPEVIGLIKKHGINLPSNAPTKLVDKAFISLTKQSDKFREDFSKLAHDNTLSFTGSNEGNWFNWMTGKSEGSNFEDTKNNFTGKNEGNWFSDPKSSSSNFTGKIEGNWFNASASQLSKQAGGASAVKTTPTTTTTTTTTSGGFKTWLTNLFSPEFTQSVLNTGLNVWSNKQIGQNAVTTQNALDQARFDLQEGSGTTASQGMGVGSIILISVVALALIGGVIYYVRKK